MCDSRIPRTNGLHDEIQNNNRKPVQNMITLPGLIAVICIIIIVLLTLVFWIIKKYCWNNRQSASLDVSRTQIYGGLPMDTSAHSRHYQLTSYWTPAYASWAPPVYPVSADIGQSSPNTAQQPESNLLPPRYSSIFDENGQEIVPVGSLRVFSSSSSEPTARFFVRRLQIVYGGHWVPYLKSGQEGTGSTVPSPAIGKLNTYKLCRHCS